MPEFLIHAHWLNQLSLIWWDGKDFLSGWLGISHDRLHLIAGMVLFPILVHILATIRHPRPRREAFLLLLAVELANEALDLALDVWPEWQRQLLGGLEDIIFTMAIPTITLLIVRVINAPRGVIK